MALKTRYDLGLLQTFCQENKIELLKDYSHEKLNRDSIIEGRCIHENCQEHFRKSFKLFVKSNGYCKTHMKENMNEKAKKTCFEKYGGHPSQTK